MSIHQQISRAAQVRRPAAFIFALSLAVGCELLGSESNTRTLRAWSPPSVANVRGVASDSVRNAIERRLATAPPASISSDSWRHVKRLYRAHKGSPLWLGARGLDRGRTKALAAAFASASLDGLRLDVFPIAATTEALTAVRKTRSPTAEQLADADVLLTAMYAMLAEDLLTGQIEPRSVGQSWYIDPPEDRIDSILALTLGTDRPADAIALLRPRDSAYSALRQELVHYRELAAKGTWTSVPKGKALKVGETDAAPRLTALAERLRTEGLLDRRAATIRPDSQRAVYDSTLAGAVARFQERHGIVVDSILGPETVSSMNVPVEYRLGQLAANLERYRWLPRSLGSHYIMVNVPAFELQGFQDGKEAIQMKVIVGAEYNERATPVFSDSMQYVIFRPYWNVPENIAEKEIFPDAAEKPGYLERNNYELVTLEGKQRIRQRPGPGNALGLVKFMFPNNFDIYLHDTPDSTLFEKDIRGFSHGCIRVEKPAELAQWVLGWSADSVRRSMLAEKNDRRVNLPAKIPVYIVYFTTYVRDGTLFFGNDLYDRDAALVKAVGSGAAPTDTVSRQLEAFRRAAG